jgi:cyclin H
METRGRRWQNFLGAVTDSFL